VNEGANTQSAESRAIQRALKQYRTPSKGRTIGQLCTSFIPYVGGLILMGALAQVSYLLSLLLALPTAGFLIRVFIVFTTPDTGRCSGAAAGIASSATSPGS
jgi:omega-6 fatty acid desaturase (delta-12 desaturase)